MSDAAHDRLLAEFTAGRTDLLFDLLPAGLPATFRDANGTSLAQTCAYFGDVSALRYLLQHGESLSALGTNFDLITASYHGHWRLCKYLLEHGANVNEADPDTRETPLHAALSKTDHITYDRVVAVLLHHGADPNLATVAGAETGAFMRDCRTKGETSLHRAAGFGGPETIQMLLNAGAHRDARDANGDTPLSWASWYGRPNEVLRPLLYGDFRIHPENRSMRASLLGDPISERNL